MNETLESLSDKVKPESEWVPFEIPPLVSENLWEMADQNLKRRGRGKGKEGKHIEALLRGRVYCPSCSRLLSTYRDSNHHHLTYYVCTTRSQGWKQKRCHIRSFRVDWLDSVIWDCIFALLKQPAFLEEQLSKWEDNGRVDELQKRIRAEQHKIDGFQAKIRRIHDGYEADPPLYTASEVKERIRTYRDMIARAQTEEKHLQAQVKNHAVNKRTTEEVRRALESLRDENLENAIFSEKQDLVAKLGIMVYPSEDHKVVRIASRLPVVTTSFSPQIISIASPKL